MDDLNQSTMTEPIERLMRRDYPSAVGIFSETKPIATQLVYIEETSGIHAVRVETLYEDCIFDLQAGVHVARDLAGNQRWLALPIDQFKRGERRHREILSRACEARGIGIILIQSKGKGQAAKVHLEAKEQEGSFLTEYPELAQQWGDIEENLTLDSEWQVVPLH